MTDGSCHLQPFKTSVHVALRNESIDLNSENLLQTGYQKETFEKRMVGISSAELVFISNREERMFPLWHIAVSSKVSATHNFQITCLKGKESNKEWVIPPAVSLLKCLKCLKLG